MNNLTKKLTFNAVIAAVYASCTVLLAPIGYGVVQVRVAECLVVLPFLFPFTMWGVTLGCVIANFFSPLGMIDVVLGSSITLIAAFLTSKIRNQYLAVLPPIVLNALVLPLIWMYFGGETVYWINVLSIALSQSVVLYALGIPLIYLAKKHLAPLLNAEQTNNI